VRTIVVPSAGHAWLVQVVGDLHALPKHSVKWLSHDTVVVTWTRRSGWVFVIAVFLFPLGLAALLFTMTEHGTITVCDDGPPGRIAVGGTFSGRAIDTVNARVPA
jgi:hypothetical protein